MDFYVLLISLKLFNRAQLFPLTAKNQRISMCLYIKNVWFFTTPPPELTSVTLTLILSHFLFIFIEPHVSRFTLPKSSRFHYTYP